jgi:hypothetical protein
MPSDDEFMPPVSKLDAFTSRSAAFSSDQRLYLGSARCTWATTSTMPMRGTLSACSTSMAMWIRSNTRRVGIMQSPMGSPYDDLRHAIPAVFLPGPFPPSFLDHLLRVDPSV